MCHLVSGIIDIVHVCPPSLVFPKTAAVVSMLMPAPPPMNPTAGDRNCAVLIIQSSLRGSPPIVASTLHRLSGFQDLPPSSLRCRVDWVVESGLSNSSPVCGFRNHIPLVVPLTVDNSAQVLPSLVPRILPRSVIAQPFFASTKKILFRSSSVASGSPPNCACQVFPPFVVNRIVDFSPATQQVSGPTHAIAFKLMSLLNGTGSQIALNLGAATVPF